MFVEQLYTPCLSEAAYYIESAGEAAVIDPVREPQPYLEKAAARGATIKYVFETHFHADFVSGHLDLALASGAQIVYGPMAETGYLAHHARDGEEFAIGDVCLRVLHTPGHTPESSCFLLIDAQGREHALFTGDTLLVGDVGRPDLMDGTVSKEALASMLYDSLHSKISPLADDVIVYPAHGPGSACGKNIGKETWSTLGAQRQSNYALQPMPRAAFVKAVTTGLTTPPQHFRSDARINRRGYDSIEHLLCRSIQPLDAAAVELEIAAGAWVLDVRSADDFAQGHIPGAINIGLEGTFSLWSGTLILIGRRLVLVVPEGQEREAVLHLARVGHENVAGFLAGGMKAWQAAARPLQRIASIAPEAFAAAVDAGSPARILDVRRPGEFAYGHVRNAHNLCLSAFANGIPPGLKPQEEYLVHCAGGYRSMIAASLLARAGFSHVANVRRGWAGIKETGVATESATRG